MQLATLALAGQAVERVFPFMVYSIPKKIVIPKMNLAVRPEIALSANELMLKRFRYGLIEYPPLIWPVKEVSREEMRRLYPLSHAT